MRTFLLKVKHFFKRNIYPITVSLCTVLVLTIIAISAYVSIANTNQSESNLVSTNTPQVSENEGSDDEGEEDDDQSQVDSSDPIIFSLPFEGATVSKEYTDSSLLYDATSKVWCTHQGIDFACEEGTTAVAVYDGVIKKIESSMMYGTIIYLEVSDGLVVVYKGLSTDVLVTEGQTVSKGDALGTISGLMMEKLDGVHLHLELTKDDELIDPTEYFAFNK